MIVGAGSAGCVVARRLLDGTDATVLLLEAGGSDEGVQSISNPPQRVANLCSSYDWAYRYEPSPHIDHRSIPLPLGGVLGESGSINALTWARGNRADYEAWAEAGNAGWDFHSIMPIFAQGQAPAPPQPSPDRPCEGAMDAAVPARRGDIRSDLARPPAGLPVDGGSVPA